MRRATIFFLMTAAVLVAGCSAARDGAAVAAIPDTTDAASFDGMQPSLGTLGSQFLEALAASDREVLRSIAISKEEFVQNVWPKLPASQPGSNLTPDWVWNQYALKNNAGLESLLQRYGGRRYEYAGIEFRGETRDYGDFFLHMNSVLRVVDGGEEKKVRLFGSVIEQAGQYKIYGFVVD